MRRQANKGGILKDDKAQALTEFAIVIPVVLLSFFALLQYLIVVQTTQLANYAAYAAARVYAVRAAVDGEQAAKTTAKQAAAMAMAPVARLVSGEAFGLGISTLAGRLPDGTFGKNFARIGEGWWVAENIRLNPGVGGGDVEIRTSGNPKQVDVEIRYPQPIFIPGLAELWVLVAGDKGIHRSLQPLREGLTGLPERVLPLAEGWEAAQELRYRFTGNYTMWRLFFPYVNVRGKCSMGYEDWGGRLRLPRTVDSSEASDPDLEQQAGELEQARKEIEELQRRANEACKEYRDAHDAVTRATERVRRTEPGTTARQAAEAELARARQVERAAEIRCNQATEAVRERSERLD